MSVQKFRISKKSSNFTMIPNKVLQGLKDAEALGLWCYLASLPPGWEFYKEQLREHFNLGIHKLNGLLKKLEAHKLITVQQMRDTNGQFSFFNMDIDDGNSFEINPISKNCNEPFYRNRNTVTVRTDISSYKENTYKENKQKRDRNGSAEFFPDEKNERLALELGVDLKRELDSFLMKWNKEKTQEAFTNWLKMAKNYQDKQKDTKKIELRSTVIEYGPGHPTWEANKEWELKHGQGRERGTKANSNVGGSGVQKIENYLPPQFGLG